MKSQHLMPKNQIKISKNFKYFDNLYWFVNSTLDKVMVRNPGIQFDREIHDPEKNKTDVDNDMFYELWEDPSFYELSEIQRKKFNNFKQQMKDAVDFVLAKPLNLREGTRVVIKSRYVYETNSYKPIFTVPVEGDTIGDVIKAYFKGFNMKLVPNNFYSKNVDYSEYIIKSDRFFQVLELNRMVYNRIGNYFSGIQRLDLATRYEEGNLTFKDIHGDKNCFAGLASYDGKYIKMYME